MLTQKKPANLQPGILDILLNHELNHDSQPENQLRLAALKEATKRVCWVTGDLGENIPCRWTIGLMGRRFLPSQKITNPKSTRNPTNWRLIARQTEAPSKWLPSQPSQPLGFLGGCWSNSPFLRANQTRAAEAKHVGVRLPHRLLHQARHVGRGLDEDSTSSKHFVDRTRSITLACKSQQVQRTG